MYYDVNKDQLQDRSKPSLQLLLGFLEANPTVSIEIAGHTDSDGTNEYNADLSQRRAETVLKFLIEKGIAKERLQAKGYGETKPIAPNFNADKTPNLEGRKANRRTEFSVFLRSLNS